MEVRTHRSEPVFASRAIISAVVIVATAFAASAGRAEENPEIKTFKIRDVDNSPPVAKVSDTTISLIGQPDSKDFGLAYRGKVTPTAPLSGDEKLVVDLYAKCDSQTPVNVGAVEIGAIKGTGEFIVIATKDAKTFVPFKDVECVKARIEGYVPKVVVERPAFAVKTFPILNGDELDDATIGDTSVSLIGDPESKDFGLAYRGKLKPTVEMTGSEKLSVYLYTKCDGKRPDPTTAVNVGSVEIGSIKKTMREYAVIAAKDAKAFVPLKDVQCATVGIE
jgi:hypothetical protein